MSQSFVRHGNEAFLLLRTHSWHLHPPQPSLLLIFPLESLIKAVCDSGCVHRQLIHQLLHPSPCCLHPCKSHEGPNINWWKSLIIFYAIPINCMKIKLLFIYKHSICISQVSFELAVCEHFKNSGWNVPGKFSGFRGTTSNMEMGKKKPWFPHKTLTWETDVKNLDCTARKTAIMCLTCCK